MAILNQNHQLQGLIGPVYTRNLNGKPVVQPCPVNPKQSKGTIASSANFSYAVEQSKMLKMALRPLLQMGTDPYASQRLTGVLHKAFHTPLGTAEHLTLFTANLSGLAGFEFHRNTPLQNFLPTGLPFSITESGTVQLNELVITPLLSQLLPTQYKGAELAVMAMSFRPNTGNTFTKEVFGFELDQHAPTTIAFETQPFTSGSRIMVAAQLLVWDNYTVLGHKNYVNNKQFNPVQLLFTGVV